ncbi:MAG: peroxiredoxin [Terracidiphilus sp.]|nr:peroxiredoxin [Terracidiphilus sp.]
MRKPVLCVLAAVLAASALIVTAHAKDQALPEVGQPAPNFTLPSQDGTKIALSSLRGHWVVLYFYPKDMTQGCTIEAHNFQRDLSLYEAKNAVILGVSVDSAESHQQFCTKESLTFHLLSDTGHKVVQKYGSMNVNSATPIADRNTFLINPEGIIVSEWTKVSPAAHSAEVLATLPAGQSPATASSAH